ncbi:MAG: metallophosphoesterase [Candidatus Fermentibacteraceae bacterium]
MNCFFVTDLHGSTSRYEKLFGLIEARRPAALFMGGDLLPGPVRLMSVESGHRDFVNDYLCRHFRELRGRMGENYPRVFLILGNDDGRFQEAAVLDAASTGIWEYVHGRRTDFDGFQVYGYSYVPPTPFLLKDWERYDVSRFADPGCSHPADGMRTVPVSEYEMLYATIQEDLAAITGTDDLSRAIFLFHSPPYRTGLDRAALDGRTVDFVPLDVHVGSIAIRRFITRRCPHLTLHGHIHESARLTGVWKEAMGPTTTLSAAHDGPELSLVSFDPEDPGGAERELI